MSNYTTLQPTTAPRWTGMPSAALCSAALCEAGNGTSAAGNPATVLRGFQLSEAFVAGIDSGHVTRTRTVGQFAPPRDRRRLS